LAIISVVQRGCKSVVVAAAAADARAGRVAVIAVAGDLAVDDALGGVVDHGGLGINNDGVAGVRPGHERLGKVRVVHGGLALDDDRLRGSQFVT